MTITRERVQYTVLEWGARSHTLFTNSPDMLTRPGRERSFPRTSLVLGRSYSTPSKVSDAIADQWRNVYYKSALGVDSYLLLESTTMIQSALQISQRANFAVLSRLIVCLVTECLLDGIFMPIESKDAAGLLVVLFPVPVSESQAIYQAITHDQVFAVVPLHHTPVVRSNRSGKSGFKADLVDPTDMRPELFRFATGECQKLRTGLRN